MKKSLATGSRSFLSAHRCAQANIYLVVLLALFGLAGCNFPARLATPITPNSTSSSNTVKTKHTEASLGTLLPTTPPATVFSTPSSTPSTAPTITVAPTRPSRPVPSATPSRACDLAAAGNPIDITIPDDTTMRPGQAFTKIWRLLNVGSCTWTEGYRVELFSGEAMSGQASQPLHEEVAPDQSVEITVDMVAPTSPGKHQGNWKLRNSDGQWFGIGPSGEAPFWVRIEVVAPPTPSPSRTPVREQPAPSETPSPTASETPTATTSATLIPEPVVGNSGTLSLISPSKLDLDRIQVIQGEEGVDLIYEAGEEGQHWLNPQGNFVMGVFGGDEPSFLDCQSASLNAAPLAAETLNLGVYLCFRTQEGRIGKARIMNFERDTGTLTMEFVTWILP